MNTNYNNDTLSPPQFGSTRKNRSRLASFKSDYS